MERTPRVPLHPELRDEALRLLREGHNIYMVRKLCGTFSESKWPGSPGDNHHRHRLSIHDSCSMYRTISQERGVYQRSSAEDNLDKWLREKNPSPPSPLLTESTLHYQAHILGKTERFELIICTPEMKNAAWTHGHRRQVLMDLTFGFCSTPALLLILMALDKETGRGLPIGFILFSAKTTAKAAHADYNTELLTRLLRLYKERLGRNSEGEEIEFIVGNTDNDPRERTALGTIWLEILLILCLFHTAQAWRNGLTRTLKQVSNECGERDSLRQRLARLIWRLLYDIKDYNEALGLYTSERTFWEGKLRGRIASDQKEAKGALAFLKYFFTYIKTKEFWFAWSPAGASEAAERLGMLMESFARTNNPLESFNGHFKNEYIEPYERSGRLVRIDLWVQLVITDVMPEFFDKIEKARQDTAYKDGLRYLNTAPARIPVHDSYEKQVMGWFDALEAGGVEEDDDAGSEGGVDASDNEIVDFGSESGTGSDPIINDAFDEPMQIDSRPLLLPAADKIVETSVDEERELVIEVTDKKADDHDEVVDTSVVEEMELEIGQDLNIAPVEVSEPTPSTQKI
jgi:hypothetical protein